MFGGNGEDRAEERGGEIGAVGVDDGDFNEGVAGGTADAGELDGVVAGGERREQSGVVAAVGEGAEAGGDGGVGDEGIRGGGAPVVVGSDGHGRRIRDVDRGIRERPGQTDGGERGPEAADQDGLAGAGADDETDGGGGSGGHRGLEIEVSEPRGERDRIGVVDFEQGGAGGAGDTVDAGGVGAGGQRDEEGGVFAVGVEGECTRGGGRGDDGGG